jgi:hypothetical protein
LEIPVRRMNATNNSTMGIQPADLLIAGSAHSAFAILPVKQTFHLGSGDLHTASAAIRLGAGFEMFAHLFRPLVWFAFVVVVVVALWGAGLLLWSDPLKSPNVFLP